MKALIVLSAAMIFAISATAANRPAGNSSDAAAAAAQARFKSIDRDRDGALDKREAKSDASIAAQFNSMDINLDGYITRAEYIAYAERSKQPQ